MPLLTEDVYANISKAKQAAINTEIENQVLWKRWIPAWDSEKVVSQEKVNFIHHADLRKETEGTIKHKDTVSVSF